MISYQKIDIRPAETSRIPCIESGSHRYRPECCDEAKCVPAPERPWPRCRPQKAKTKVCSTCGKPKMLSEFQPRSDTSRGGKQAATCIQCRTSYWPGKAEKGE